MNLSNNGHQKKKKPSLGSVWSKSSKILALQILMVSILMDFVVIITQIIGYFDYHYGFSIKTKSIAKFSLQIVDF